MMKLAVVGATGPTGQALIKEALSKGHQVVALVRSPEKNTEKNEALTVTKVDLFKPEELVPHLSGCDAVVSGLGYHQGMSFFKPVSLYEDSMKSITSAMKQAEVSRVVCITSWCTEYSPGNPKIVEWFVRPVMIGKTLKSMANMEHFLEEECPDINYTVVRPPELTAASEKGSCPVFPGMKSIQMVNRCYVKGVYKLTFSDAVDFCETQLGLHLLFIESSEEQYYWDSYMQVARKDAFWLGISQSEGRSYWTHFSSMVGTEASVTYWSSVPSSNPRVVIDFRITSNKQWIEVDLTAKYYTICELETSLNAFLSDFLPLLSLKDTTADISSPTTSLGIATTTTENSATTEERNLVLTSKFIRMRGNISLFEVNLSYGFNTLSCAAQCLRMESYCYALVFKHSQKTCRYFLQMHQSSGKTIDCSVHDCYRKI